MRGFDRLSAVDADQRSALQAVHVLPADQDWHRSPGFGDFTPSFPHRVLR